MIRVPQSQIFRELILGVVVVRGCGWVTAFGSPVEVELPVGYATSSRNRQHENSAKKVPAFGECFPPLDLRCCSGDSSGTSPARVVVGPLWARLASSAGHV